MGIKDLAEKYKLGKSDFWEMKFGGKSMWIITHDAVEKIADMDPDLLIDQTWERAKVSNPNVKKSEIKAALEIAGLV